MPTPPSHHSPGESRLEGLILRGCCGVLLHPKPHFSSPGVGDAQGHGYVGDTDVRGCPRVTLRVPRPLPSPRVLTGTLRVPYGVSPGTTFQLNGRPRWWVGDGGEVEEQPREGFYGNIRGKKKISNTKKKICISAFRGGKAVICMQAGARRL